MQATIMCTSIHGVTINSNTCFMHSFIEEDGELKILRSKEFSNPEEYSDFYGAMAAAEKAAVS